MGLGKTAAEEVEDILSVASDDFSRFVSSEGINSSASSVSPMVDPLPTMRRSHRKVRFVIPHWLQQSVPP